MPEYLVGTGGWSYFTVGNKPSLRMYSEIFNFVEANYTFYEFPSILAVEGWRRIVPSDFVFSVRCHQDLTHKIGLKPTNQAYEIFYQIRSYCDALNSQYLVLETPASDVINSENLHDSRDFFSSLNLKGIQLVWEYRAPSTETSFGVEKQF